MPDRQADRQARLKAALRDNLKRRKSQTRGRAGSPREADDPTESAVTMQDRIRIEHVETLSDDWYVLKKTTFLYRRRDGTWQPQSRETYDRGNGAAILLCDVARGKLILTRQFRFPAFVNGHPEPLIEAAAGILDDASPEERIRIEAEEETGYRVTDIRKVFEAFMSPGSVTEKLHLFIGHYGPDDRISTGGGIEAEGEDIEVLEIDADEAFRMLAQGDIQDAKTIILLQYAALHVFPRHRGAAG